MTIDMKQHEAAVDAALANLKTFLMTPDHGDGSWPDIPQEELGQARDLVGEMFDLKWGRDVDDDSPVRVRIWHKGQERMVCDWAFIDTGPRVDEAAEAQEARWLRNMNTISSASAACAEELRRLHIEMADVHARKLRRNAAFEVHQVRYQRPPGWSAGENIKDYPVSIHLTAADADAFIATQAQAGVKAEVRAILKALPSSRERADDGFAEYRRKVEEQCGKLLGGFQVRQDLNLQHVRNLRRPDDCTAQVDGQ
ncbi:hypothetical protein WJ96_05925 [Burkholderia ubonensis]|uniref:Large polyvalent protein associated domain-containing protein n=1 Tax=Burkholderia ubonensis TaxID=101571 RepID=A0AAW3MU27_9BURK|nr:hypothetical protein [Burkholderia ubonensis]KVP75294.1 hypothetical protein WJ93_07720 [Burkholderia ubonensis]KVP96762.1 hypothetical protein WJ97_12850 [Burkholderia ubonensis]KVP98107.1 hypothetical protein WJ96_05925 [Burkholderia ubonensis]KVZ92804.1 hypothetical protein WL25_17585 [Burkholderia ubonensis]